MPNVYLISFHKQYSLDELQSSYVNLLSFVMKFCYIFYFTSLCNVHHVEVISVLYGNGCDYGPSTTLDICVVKLTGRIMQMSVLKPTQTSEINCV